MYMLYVLKRFKGSAHDLTAVYQMYIRPVLEYASPLWHSSLTQCQIEQLELIQKRACQIVLGSEYTSYAEAMETLQLCSLVERREQLLRGFGEKLFKLPCSQSPKRKGTEETWEALTNLIHQSARQLASGSQLSQLLLTVSTMHFLLCKFCCFCVFSFIYIYIVCNSDISVLDCISVLFIP